MFSPGISLEGMMLKLKLQYFGHLMWRVDSYWEGLRAGGEGDDRGWDGWMASLTQWMWVWVNSRNWWWTGRPGVLRFMGLQRVGHDWAARLNWTELNVDFSVMMVRFVIWNNLYRIKEIGVEWVLPYMIDQFNSSVNYMPSIGSHTENLERKQIQSLCSWVSKYGRILPARMRGLVQPCMIEIELLSVNSSNVQQQSV